MLVFLPAIHAAAARRRTCSRCGRRVLVPASRRRQTVTCRHCRAPIPPPARHPSRQ